VSGMIIGSFFTLFAVPAIYMLVARVHRADEVPETETVEVALPASI